jgi:lipopolysaccharide transport system permease protein
MAVYTIVFRAIIRIHIDPGRPSGLNVYALYLLCALLPWSFFQVSVQGGIVSLIGNSNLIKKTYFPREYLPAATVASTFVSHCIEMGLLLVTLVAFGNYRALAFVPLVFVLMLFVSLFALGLALMLSVMNVYFRDVEYLITIVFLVWMYLTPIIYPFTLVPHRYQEFVKIANPMTDAVLAFRSMLYDGTTPGWLGLGYFFLVAVITFTVGMYVFNRLEGRLAEEL